MEEFLLELGCKISREWVTDAYFSGKIKNMFLI